MRSASSPLLVCMLVSCVLQTSGYVLTGARMEMRAPAVRMAESTAPRGFGKQKPKPQAAKPPKKSANTVQRDKAAADFDKLRDSGSPEYMVLIRTVPATGEPSVWYPVGGIAVPRSNSEDTALSMAIFNNEDDLLKGAFKAYPALKKSEDKFEYGYRLKEFPDDPVKVASEEKTKETTNPLMQWFNMLDSPLNKD